MLESITLLLQLFLCSVMPSAKCTPSETTLEISTYALTNADTAIAVAQEQQDWRLLGLGSRTPTLLGTPAEEFNDLQQRCGMQVISSDDHIRSSSQQEDYSEQERYVVYYNQQMLPLCLANTPTP
jgi:hypothetical protein